MLERLSGLEYTYELSESLSVIARYYAGIDVV